jgi:hypothetical protein
VGEELKKMDNAKGSSGNWLVANKLMQYVTVIPERRARTLFERFVDAFVDPSFIKEPGEVGADKLTVEELAAEPFKRLNKKLIRLSENWWVRDDRLKNEEKHRSRVKEILLNRKSLAASRIYWHMRQIGDICIVGYEDLEKFIDKATASDEYYLFDNSLTWCLAVNHEYCIIVCGNLLNKP